mmetsp:Transcript_21221/g.39608  ORF Transcript_21221/g.39608 Transcript_21221/m.39608 type:complete len:327 (+) Transcript_21221:183-1163(+)|eukprot:CAMPEP_0114415394 /NCGR_PEP_ID=MMETSP0103-20121206/1888_1 /TAXON_ID=37642 ORGANISM="Paraphysomonas imperforata, Strain PA2" /NCGR_SAMPLE_ID=MMETSP0103 /ASSEMBLY_ACC=CAM_ASM_000201 /LENGTH=326 /DNA_ID=CAMNT_0001583579 /DNA_START=132 /DNA_END=1112 /DNA_ORIENTATION=+
MTPPCSVKKTRNVWLPSLVFSVVCILLYITQQYLYNFREAKAHETRLLSSSPINNAPHLPVRSSECRSEVLWGLKDHGGWYVCLDALTLNPAGQVDTSTSALGVSTPQHPCVVYSFGLGADWSFDKDAEKHGCHVHGFDPTNNLWQQGMHGTEYSHFDYAKQYPSKQRFFHNWGLGALDSVVYPPGTFPQDWPGLGDPPFSKTNTQPWVMKSIEQTMADLGHSRLSVLKIDVEGSEWSAVAAMLESRKMRKMLASGSIEQLLFEFHWNPDTHAMNQRYDVILRRLEALGFVAWKVERHVGSDCCLDMSYVWKQPKLRKQIDHFSKS